MPGGQRSQARQGSAQRRQARRRGAAYWLALGIGCLAIVVIAGLIYIHFQPQAYTRILPTPTYSTGPGGLYSPGVTLIPNPPVTPTP